jgi:ketosteroid isomerase-like protein
VTDSSNVDLVRSIAADWERGDFSSADRADPEIEFVIADWPDAGTWSGLAGLTEGMREFLRTWEDFSLEPDESREHDDGRVVVSVRVHGRGKTSGLELEQTFGTRRGASVFHIRDRKVTRLAIYWDRDHALADLGLKE